MELCRRNRTSCLALIQSAEIPHLPIVSSLWCQLVRADKCLFTWELGQAMVHTILVLLMATSICDDSIVVLSLQRLDDCFLIMERDFENAKSCYQTAIDYLKDAGLQRHVADCALRLGIILLLEGKVLEAKQILMNS